MGGVDYTAKLVVGVKDGQTYYDHALTQIEKSSLIESIDPINTGFANNEAANSRVKDKRLLSLLQTNSSKVVDENGEPMVVYHGTKRAGFTVFDTKGKYRGKNATTKDTGVYASDDRWTAYNYTPRYEYENRFDYDFDNPNGTGYVYPLFMNLRNPLIIDCKGEDFDEIRYNGRKTSTDSVVRKLRKGGFGEGLDGVIFKNVYDVDYTTDFVALDSNQIKSATDNVGTFSAENDDIRYHKDANTDEEVLYRIRENEPPKKTGIGYKVFVLKDGKLYPPMVANPDGAETPVGVWLDADAAPISGQSKTGRNQVKAGGKGTQGGSGQLAYRPGWHLGEIPYALQFNRTDTEGNRTLFPKNFVWAEVEYADDVDYQEEAMSYGYNKNGKFQHSYAGLPRVPENGAYHYRTNPNPETDPWIITGAMRVKRLLKPSEVDEMVRQAGREPQPRQEGAVTDAQIEEMNERIGEAYREAEQSYTDEQLSTDNDPQGKFLGESTRTKKQREAFAKRERERMKNHVEELSKRLHLDNVEIIEDASQLEGRRSKAKGFYNPRTGKITIVLGNHRSTYDIEQTLLHEAVAHHGLRKLFGEHFNTFLDNVFNGSTEEIRREIVELSKKHNWDFRTATEEYLASLAERTDFENVNASWWQKVKDFFVDILRKIGFKSFAAEHPLTDNELRYILWRSYQDLKEPGRRRSLFAVAEDIAKQQELKVGEYAPTETDAAVAAEELFRDGDPEAREQVEARDRYERRMRSGMFQFREAMQDSMLSLKNAMGYIKEAKGKKMRIEDVAGYENAYLGENRLSSVNKAEADFFANAVFKPLLEEVNRLAKNKEERQELIDYMMAKHGLERNVSMAERFAKRAKAEGDSRPLADIIAAYRQQDFAGLTALTGKDNVAEAESVAAQMVADFESKHETDELWKKTKAVSDAILSKAHETGLISDRSYKKIKSLYDFYIPLQGFDEKTSEQAYAYFMNDYISGNAPIIERAEMRTSKADDPIANMQSMMESAILQGNRNSLVKQRFLNFVLNNPSDLVSISDLWLEYDSVNNEWHPVFPDNINANDTGEVVAQKMKDFEKRMNKLAAADPSRYKRQSDAIDIPYRVLHQDQMAQHQVIVKRNGKDVVLTVNGNPRLAQALNGQTNPDNDMSGAIGAILKAGEKVNRQLSAFYTTRNPDFVLSNFMRDALYSNSMVWVKEGGNYALRFNRNFSTKTTVAQMKSLFKKYRNGKLDMGNKTEKMFRDFILNGGETGYSNLRDLEKRKKDIAKELKRMSHGKISPDNVYEMLRTSWDELNRSVENAARFAAFMTSREMGRTIDRAIYDAKEISVNFNKKGSGAKFFDANGQTKLGNAAAMVSGLGRSGYVFWNAAIQGTTNFGRQFKRHPVKALTASATMFILGAVIAYMGGSGDDDDDKNAYYNLPEYVRRSNLMFRAGDSWISIPLPVEYRALYGMGELMISAMSGKEHFTDGELAEAIASQMSQVLPLDFLEGGGGLNAFVPSSIKPIAESYGYERDWTGMPLYKDTPYNKNMPEWTKAYKSANKYLVGLSEVLNEVSGGDRYTKGAIDINPAKVENLLSGYFGGVEGTIDRIVKMVEMRFGDREYDPRSILLWNRVVKAGDERTEGRAVNKEYYRVKEEHDKLKTRVKRYEDDTEKGIFDYAEKLDFLYNSPEYARYEIFEEYKGDIDALYEELKETTDKDEQKQIEAELTEKKKEMMDEMNKTRK